MRYFLQQGCITGKGWYNCIFASTHDHASLKNFIQKRNVFEVEKAFGKCLHLAVKNNLCVWKVSVIVWKLFLLTNTHKHNNVLDLLCIENTSEEFNSLGTNIIFWEYLNIPHIYILKWYFNKEIMVPIWTVTLTKYYVFVFRLIL